jgi:hypothetical protein
MLQFGLKPRGHVLNNLHYCKCIQALPPQSNYRRCRRTGDRKNRVKVGVKRHHRSVLSNRPCKDLLVGGSRHSDLTHVSAVKPEFAQQTCGVARNSLIQDQSHYDLYRSGGACFGGAVFEVGGGKRQRLLNIVRLQLRVVPEEVGTIRI